MIALINVNPFKIGKVQYAVGDKVFVKEILQSSITGMKGLSTVSQIKNLQALINENITVYDSTLGTYANKDSSFAFGYVGTASQSGLTFNTPFVTVSTGWTFVTSAATIAVAAANNLTAGTAFAVAVGNTFDIAYSGNTVSTQTWYNSLLSTSFSGSGISVIGMSPTININSGATITISLSANTDTSTVTNFVFVDNNVKRSAYTLFNSLDFNAGLVTLAAYI